MAALIEIEGLTKRFGAFTAVDKVSFQVARGEVLAQPSGRSQPDDAANPIITVAS